MIFCINYVWSKLGTLHEGFTIFQFLDNFKTEVFFKQIFKNEFKFFPCFFFKLK